MKSFSKKSKKSTKKHFGAKRAKISSVSFDRSNPSVSKSVYSSNTPHYFKRQLDDGVFYTSAANTVSVVNAVGSAPTWLSLGGLTSDQGGVAATGQFGFSVSPSLNMVVNATEFTNLFQQYQIMGLSIQVESMMGDSYQNGNGQIPTLYISEDFNDSVAPPSFAAIQNNDSTKTYRINQELSVKRFARPAPAMQLFQSALNTGYGTPSKDVWLDTTGVSASLPHYVFKGYIRNWIVSAANTGVAMRITPTLYFRCRGTH